MRLFRYVAAYKREFAYLAIIFCNLVQRFNEWLVTITEQTNHVLQPGLVKMRSLSEIITSLITPKKEKYLLCETPVQSDVSERSMFLDRPESDPSPLWAQESQQELPIEKERREKLAPFLIKLQIRCAASLTLS